MIKFTAVKGPLASLVVWLVSARFACADDAQDWAAIDRIEKRLQQIVLPKFEFHDAKLQDVLDYADQLVREQDKSGGIPVFIDQREIRFDEYGPLPPSSEIRNRKISVVLKNASLHHALDYAAAVADVSLSIHPDGIHLIGGYAPDYLLTREFQIPPEFFRSVPPGTSDPTACVKAAVLDYFVPELGWFSPENDSWEDSHMCVFNATATRMTVRDTKENLERIEKSLTFPETPYIPGPEVPKVLSADAEARMRHAWQRNILPKVSLKDTPLEEAVQYLRLRQYPDGSFDHYGILYESPNSRDYRKISDVRPLPDTADADPKVTYTAKNISAWDALHAVAHLTRLEVLPTGWALRLAPHNTIYTRRYLIPPDAWPQSKVKAPPVYADGREGGQEWLMAGGVQFGQGSFLRFAFKDRTLLVSNTVTEHGKIQSMVEKAWRTYYATLKTGKGKAQQAVSAPNGVTNEAKDQAAVARIWKTLDQVVLRSLNYDQIPAEEALLFLVDRIRAQKIDGHPIAVSMLAQPKDGPAPSNSLLSAPPTNSLKWKISVSFENIRLADALDYVIESANLRYNVRPDGIEIVPGDQSDWLFQRDLPVPPDFLPAYEKQDQIDHTEFAGKMRQHIHWFLEDNGIFFYPGATARISADATHLMVRQPDIQLQTIADILQRTRPPCLFPTYELREPKIIAHGENAAVLRKVQRIILPEVKFDGTHLIDAVQVLRDLSVQHDTESSPDQPGVNIVLEEAIASPPSQFSTKSDPRDDPTLDYSKLPTYLRGFDYTGTDVTLLEALEAVAKRGKWELQFDRSSAILCAPTSGKAMITQEYLLSPYWAAWIAARSRWPSDDLIRGLLLTNGVRFPAGSSFRYEASTSRLTLQNSEAEQRNARQWVERIWRSYYDARAGRKTKANPLAD